MDDLDERRLMDGLRRDNPESYERLVKTYGGRMLAVARRFTRNEEDARDCVQVAFLKAFQNISGFEQRSSLATWLHRIVVNAALMKLRSRERRPETSIDDLLPEFDGSGMRLERESGIQIPLETLLESQQTRELVRRAIDRLPANHRTVLMLRDIEEYDTETTAELLELTPGAVKTRLHRARAALKTLLEPVFEGDSL